MSGSRKGLCVLLVVGGECPLSEKRAESLRKAVISREKGSGSGSVRGFLKLCKGIYYGCFLHGAVVKLDEVERFR